MTAACEKMGHRQLHPTAARVSTQPLAVEIASEIVQGQGDERLVRQGAGTGCVDLAAICPAESGFKQTVEGRRNRLKRALMELLAEKGWIYVSRCVFTKEARLSEDTLRHTSFAR
jgi:hypothetical protein